MNTGEVNYVTLLIKTAPVLCLVIPGFDVWQWLQVDCFKCKWRCEFNFNFSNDNDLWIQQTFLVEEHTHYCYIGLFLAPILSNMNTSSASFYPFFIKISHNHPNQIAAFSNWSSLRSPMYHAHIQTFNSAFVFSSRGLRGQPSPKCGQCRAN